ncbi:hypothetical protein HDU76_010561 [Blyttiomyces sp. JEL0837]|nr:hypothetical protein HDU76_010561 [Blyttiomyces sp. JEL0837]
MRDNVDAIELNIRNRAVDPTTVDVRRVAKLYDEHITKDFEVAEIRRRRNRIAEEMADVVASLKNSSGKKSAGKQATGTGDEKPQTHDLTRRRTELAEAGRDLKKELQVKEIELAEIAEALFEEAKHVPNDTAPGVPVGDESKAEVMEIVGSMRIVEDPVLVGAETVEALEASAVGLPARSTKSVEMKDAGAKTTTTTTSTRLRDHVELAHLHDLADFDRAGKVSGTGFYYLKNVGALLETALTRYALDLCMSKGFTPVTVPDLIRHEVLEGCGFAPRSNDPQTYFVNTHAVAGGGNSSAGSNHQTQNLNQQQQHHEIDPMRLVLSATAEFPLAAMHAGEVLHAHSLPLRLVGVGRAFRAEGLAGAINRGLYRVHQFSKVEMFAITDGNGSDAMLEEFREIQKELFEGLELCFRVLNMPTQDLGAPAYKKYDMEAWMPGRNSWGEISSASNCTDYQSRRLSIRHFKHGSASANTSGTGTGTDHENAGTGHSHSAATSTMDFVHTVNGTAAAIPRLIIALLETHQTLSGDIVVPGKLRPYLFGSGVDRLKVGESVLEMMKRGRELN